MRLPAGAHRRVAGTEALTDLVVLRRRDGGRVGETAPWVTSAPVQIDGDEALLNRYFAEHPEHVAGSLTFDTGPYTRELSVEGDTSAEAVSGAILAVAETLAPPAAAKRPLAHSTEPVDIPELPTGPCRAV